jgi:hypothetical protein
MAWTGSLCIATVSVTYDDGTNHPEIAAMIGDGRDLGRSCEQPKLRSALEFQRVGKRE